MIDWFVFLHYKKSAFVDDLYMLSFFYFVLCGHVKGKCDTTWIYYIYLSILGYLYSGVIGQFKHLRGFKFQD